VLQDEYLKVLIAVYFLKKEKQSKPVHSGNIAQTLSLGDEEVISELKYLIEKGYIKSLGGILGNEAYVEPTSKGIDYIENPYDSLRKDEGLIVSQVNNLNISNIGSQGATINVIDSSIILRNALKINNDEQNEVNHKLDESNENLYQIMGGIKESLEKSDRVVVAQKLSLFQKIVSKVKDFQVLLQSTLSVYEIFKIIFHL
jgi:predicted transcriptional regulator